ncbi:hypothetical protein C1645_816938, partial [Glomus cerebriforme]
DYDLHLAFDICEGKRPLIPEYTPEPYADLMERCWDPDPTNRPTAYELWKKLNAWNAWNNYFFMFDSLKSNEKLLIEKAFSYRQEVRWKARLAELAANQRPLKKSQNLLTSKCLDFFKQLLETKDVEMKENDHGM